MTREARSSKVTASVYVTSVAAELTGMHPQTLRICERKGLVTPTRTQGGNRRYSDEDIALLQRIADLTADGMNLSGVKRVLALEARVAELEVEVDQLREMHRGEVESIRNTARQERRDLVPLRQSVRLYRDT